MRAVTRTVYSQPPPLGTPTLPSVERLRLAAAPRFAAIDRQFAEISDRQRENPKSHEEHPEKLAEFSTMCLTAIDRLTNNRDAYAQQALREVERHQMTSPELAVSLYGLTRSLRHDLDKGWLTTFDEMTNANVLGSFLDLAAKLLRQAHTEPAAVVLASVLETRLCQLAGKYAIPITARIAANKIDLRPLQQLNDDLAQVAYHRDDHYTVSRWLLLHQRAMLREPGRYDRVQLTELVQQLRKFIAKYPA